MFGTQEGGRIPISAPAETNVRRAMVRVFLLGHFQALVDHGPLPLLEGRKAQELFAFLCLGQDRPYDREFLATLLWPDQEEAQARRYLRKVMWQLQSGLGQDGACLLGVDQESVYLHASDTLWIDATHFERAFTAVRNVPGEMLAENQVEVVREATQLYRGDLLEGWYLDWCLVDRQRIQHIYLTLIDKLIRYCLFHGQYDSAVQYGHKILSYDNAREHTHQELMILYYLSGDRTGAIRQYQRCVKTLARELGVLPAEKTQRLYEQIRAGELVLDDTATESFSRTQQQLPRRISEQSAILLNQDIRALKEQLTRFQQHLKQFTDL